MLEKSKILGDDEKVDIKIERDSIFITVDELRAISDTVVNVISSDCSDYESLYKNEKAKEMIFKLFDYFGFSINENNKIGEGKFKDLILQFFKEKFGVPESDIEKDPKKMCIFLASEFYNSCLKEMQGNGGMFNRNKMYECLYGLLDIGELKNNEIEEEIYKNVYALDLEKLKFESLDSFKEYMKEDEGKNLDIKGALQTLQQKSADLYASNQTNGYDTTYLEEQNRNTLIDAPGSSENRSEKEQRYLEYIENTQGGVLSKSDIDNLFGDFYKNGQGSVGDCYFVAALRALARIPEFDTLIRTSLRCNKDGSYTVKLPLGEPGGKDFIIYPEEIKLAFMDGRDGYKILELAFVKYLTDKDKISNQEDIKEIEVGNGGVALNVLLGNEGYKMTKHVSLGVFGKDWTEKEREPVLKDLKNFNPQNGDIITVVRTAFKPAKGEGSKISNRHVLSVKEVEKDEKGNVISVTLENPWNDAYQMDNQINKLSIEDFFNFASQIQLGHTTNDFLDTKTSTNIEVKHARDLTKQHFSNLFRKPLKNIGRYITEHQGFKGMRANKKQTLKDLFKGCKNTILGLGKDIRGTIKYAGKTLIEKGKDRHSRGE